LKVLLNEEDKGEYFFLLTPADDVLFLKQDLFEMGIKDVPEDVEIRVEDKEYVPLKSLFPLVRFEIEEKEAVLRITADPKILKRHIIDLAYRRPFKVFHTKDNSAFLNYSLGYDVGDDLDFTSFTLPFEAGISIEDFLGFSSFSYTKTDTEERFVRLFTNITGDDRAALRRFIIGDFSAFSGALGSGGTFGGLSISKNFSIKPHFIRFPGLDISGILETPSDVEVYLNDILVKRAQLPPGEFDFLNLPGVTGSGDATIVITDAFGREQRTVTPFYHSTLLLKPGLHEYSYNLGFKRDELGKESFKYNDLAFVGFHRLGLSRTFTGGVRAETDGDTVNIGPTTKYLIGRIGELDTSIAVSYDDGRYGYGAFLRYLYVGKGLSGRFSLRGFTKEYANLSVSAEQDKSQYEWLAGMGYNHRRLGAISVTYSQTDRYTGMDRKTASIFYSRRLTNDIFLYIRASRTRTDDISDKEVDEVFAGLNIYLGKRRSANLSRTIVEERATEKVSVQQNPPLGTGFGYRLLTERAEDDEGDHTIGGNASVQYRGPFGIYSADYRRIAEENSYSLNASGGISFINGSLYFSRPITDSFALVKVADLEDVRVLYNNQEVGFTNRNGKVLVPGLFSYYDNMLSIEAKDIPINYELREIEKFVTTSFRGGGVVKFEMKKIQAFTGRLFLVKENKKTEAEYAGLEIMIDGKKIDTIVGMGGKFYLENLPSGRIPAMLFLKGKECDFEIVVPESDDIIVDMGVITCEID
jgi:outer membrane usher protein